MGCSGEVGVKREQDKNISDSMLKSAAEKKRKRWSRGENTQLKLMCCVSELQLGCASGCAFGLCLSLSIGPYNNNNIHVNLHLKVLI